jgi:hypothetical protein
VIASAVPPPAVPTPTPASTTPSLIVPAFDSDDLILDSLSPLSGDIREAQSSVVLGTKKGVKGKVLKDETEVAPTSPRLPLEGGLKKSSTVISSISSATPVQTALKSEKVEKTVVPPVLAVPVVVPDTPAMALAVASKALLAATAGTGPSITRILECPQTRVGIVIGTKGSVIMEMMKKSTCKIVINQDFPDGVAREIIFTGTKEQVEAAKVLVNAVIIHGPIILANVEVLSQATVAAIAITNPSTSTTSGVLHARQAGKAQATAQLVRSVGVANAAIRVESTNVDNILSLEEKDKRDKVRRMMMTTPAVTHQFDESDTLCVICAEPFREGERILAFGACNHKGPCSVCTIRMRAVGGDFSCALCRQVMTFVVCTTRDQPYEDFNLPVMTSPSSDMIYHTKGRIFMPKGYFQSAVAPLFEFRCRECKEVFNDCDLLRSHYESAHSLTQCGLCSHHKQVIIYLFVFLFYIYVYLNVLC